MQSEEICFWCFKGKQKGTIPLGVAVAEAVPDMLEDLLLEPSEAIRSFAIAVLQPQNKW